MIEAPRGMFANSQSVTPLRTVARHRSFRWKRNARTASGNKRRLTRSAAEAALALERGLQLKPKLAYAQLCLAQAHTRAGHGGGRGPSRHLALESGPDRCIGRIV